MGPIDATLHCLARPFTWSGRASRSEYWWFTLVFTIVWIAIISGLLWPIFAAAYAEVQGQATLTDEEFAIMYLSRAEMLNWAWVISIWPTLCGLAVAVRRLHDTDRSGWWYWISIVPFIGWIILLILLILPGDDTRNDYGNPPGGGRAAGEIGRMGAAPAATVKPLDPTIPAPTAMGPVASVVTCLMKPITWRGRAGAGEFWWYTLFYFVLSTAASWYLLMPVMHEISLWETASLVEQQRAYQDFRTPNPPPFPDLVPALMVNATGWIIYMLFSIPTGLSWLAVCVRRLHDTDHSGWFYWISLIPVIGTAFLIILLATPGQIQRNRFGPGHGVPVEGGARNGDMPVVPRDPLAGVSSPEALRALRESRMPSTA